MYCTVGKHFWVGMGWTDIDGERREAFFTGLTMPSCLKHMKKEVSKVAISCTGRIPFIYVFR